MVGLALCGGDLREAYSCLWLQAQRANEDRIIRTVMRIRSELAKVAKSHHRPDVARLIRIDAASLAAGLDQPLPPIKDFVLEIGLNHCSPSEQIDTYVKVHGLGRARSARVARLIAKQWQALSWFEQVAVQEPSYNDPLDRWLSPLLSTRLQRTGLTTLGALATRINDLGLRWWIGIPSFTASKAERVVQWLRIHQHTIGVEMAGLRKSSEMA